MRRQLIYCCGDSHTAGGETADDMLWPDAHPGFYGRDTVQLRDMRQITRWREHRSRSLQAGNPVNHHGWQVEEKKHSYPARLQKLLGSEVHNAAVIGSSMEWISRQVTMDICSMHHHDTDIDITVIMQPATWLRVQIHDPLTGWTSMQMSHGWGVDTHVHQWFNAVETETSLLTRWLLAMISAMNMLDSLGIRTLLVDSGSLNIEIALSQQPTLQGLIDRYHRLTETRWHGQGMHDAAQGIDMCYCPDLHWTRPVHDAFARSLADVLA